MMTKLSIYFKNIGCQCTADSDGQIQVMAECDHYDYLQYNDSDWYELIQIICILNLSVFMLNYLWRLARSCFMMHAARIGGVRCVTI